LLDKVPCTIQDIVETLEIVPLIVENIV